MTAELWSALIGQTVVIVIAIIAATIRTERRITRVETKVEHLEDTEETQDHKLDRLGSKVGGISRALARLEGRQDRPASESQSTQ